MEFFLIIIFFIIINLYFSLFLNFNQTNKNLISLIFFFIFMSLFIIFYYKFEFLGYAYLLVYVGAIAVLFLFLLISVNIKVESRKIIFNKHSINFFVLFNIILFPLYFLFSSIYDKIKTIDVFSNYYNFLYIKYHAYTLVLNKGVPLQLKEEKIFDVNWNLDSKTELMDNLFFNFYKNGINNIDTNSFLRYTEDKITILGDYFLIYHGFFLITISILLFISVIVSVTICLSTERASK